MACAEYSFHVPSLEELVGVLQKGLTDNFAEVQVSVVDCPDLTKEPFTFPIKGKQSLQLAFPFQTKSFPETKIIFKDYLKLSPDKGYCPNF